MAKKVKTKICTKCGKRKSLNGFHKLSNHNKDGLHSWCKSCKSKERKTYYQNNKKNLSLKRKKYYKTHREESRTLSVKKSFGVTLEEYDNYYSKTLKEQNGRCAKCGVHCSEKRLVLDHDHNEFGVEAFRGLLCDKCNLGIGLLGDTLEGLMEAINYLKRHDS